MAIAQIEEEYSVDCFLKAITWMWEFRLHLIIENKWNKILRRQQQIANAISAKKLKKP